MTCIGCRSHQLWQPCEGIQIDLCTRGKPRMVGYTCSIGCVDTTGCANYQVPSKWPEGAIA